MAKRNFPLPGLWALAILAALSCSDDPAGESRPASDLRPGELCDASNRPTLRLAFDPPSAVVAPGALRSVRLTVEPDQCEPSTAAFTSDDASIAAAPAEGRFDLRHATYDFQLRGDAVGRTKLRTSMNAVDVNGTAYTVTAELPVDVRDPAPLACAGSTNDGALGPGANVLRGAGALASAALTIPPAAFTRADELALPPFTARVACSDRNLAAELPEAKLVALGPAVSYAATASLSNGRALRREIEIALPVNPAAFPPAGRLRHLQVLYTGPRAKTARAIPVSNPRIESEGEGYVLRFGTPWLGTYQAAVEPDAGARVRKRKITHRAVIGFSMGGGGAASVGLRHHDMFDAIGPLGGPSDWTWMLWYIEKYALGGFCPAGKTCPKVAPNLYPGLEEPLARSQDYENWIFEKGSGNGGTFPRSSYIQIFEDLALGRGNPNGSNDDTSLLHVARGPKKADPWIQGDAASAQQNRGDCSFTLDPIKDDPDNAKQRDIEAKCAAARCDPANAWRAETGYFDDEYNPDGSLPVISFCDGAQAGGDGAYVNRWAPGGTTPMNLALAVDLNKNGVRDEGEPIIRSGHEPFEDCGIDGLCNPHEPGYDAETNPDPNQDDYDYTLNPSGTEGDHRYELGETFDDVGLDGVANTKTRHVAGDPGEGDGIYSQSIGAENFYANDPHLILSKNAPVPGGELTDDALARLDVLADGGVRDLFNFGAVANHLMGQVAARKRANGLPLRPVHFYNGFHFLPGQPQDKPNNFEPSALRWADIADNASVRYGDVDASRAMIEQGDGQHVGTPVQLLQRLQTAFFFVGRRWQDADRMQTEESRDKPAKTTKDGSLTGADLEKQLDCEITGRCEHFVEGPRTGRLGPIAVSLPPGYAHEANVARTVTYPTLYVLHGYGQDPRDLEAVAIFTNNFMNVAERSSATRLPKFILVYVDGRCRAGKNGKPECARGTFYLDSNRPDGPQMDAWFMEVVEFVEKRYRTMGTVEAEWTE